MITLFIFLIGYFYFRKTFSGKKEKDFINENKLRDGQIESDFTYFNEGNSEDISVISFDNLKLTGKILKTKSNVYVLSFHGYHGMYRSRIPMVKCLYEKYNANILVVNQRGHFNSEGKYTTLGYLEGKYDVKSWVNYILSINKDAQIILDGVSMGAATVARSLKEVGKEVKCAICDCGFNNLYEEIKFEYLKKYKFISSIALWTLPLYFKIRYHFSIKKDALINEGLKVSKTPTLFIHAKDDHVVPFSNLVKNLDDFNKETYFDVLKFENGGHARTFYKHRDEYINKVLLFTSKFIK